MTAKRDLKKRIRDRQAKTGESYTTARRHVLAARDAHDGDHEADDAEKTGPKPDVLDDPEATNPGAARLPDSAAQLEVVDLTRATGSQPAAADGHEAFPLEDKPQLGFEPRDRFTDELKLAREPFEVDADELAATARHPIDVDEVIDVSTIASELGLRCKALVYERLTKLVEPRLALIAVRDALEATKNDPATGMLRAVATGDKPTAIPPRTWRGDPDFMARVAAGLSAVSLDGRILALHVNGFAGMVSVFCAAWRHNQTLILTTPEDRIGPALARIVPLPRERSLFMIYEGRRYPMTSEPFVIGRHPSCQLQIRDGFVSRKHASIVQRHGTYYILDLGSHAGIEYRGMRISNKRIDEGDMFMLHEYALRFTFHETDA